MSYVLRQLISPIAAMVAILTMGMAAPAHADLQIWISESNNPPNGGNEVASAAAQGTPGSVTYTNTNFDGNLSIKATGGGSDSPGSPTFASLSSSTTSLQNTSSGVVTVFISIGANGYTAPLPPPAISVLTNVSATVNAVGTGSSNSLLFNSYVVNNNGQNNTSGVTTSQSLNIASTGAPGTSTTFTVGTLNAPYSLTELYQIKLNPGAFITLSASTNLSQVASVPEPSTMAIAGIGALGMMGYGLRRRKSNGA
jgi:hypothetical protein